jgi:hypothetical protein
VNNKRLFKKKAKLYKRTKILISKAVKKKKKIATKKKN